MLGKRPYDQTWIDESIESGVAGCLWARPQARPASIDAQKAVVAVKRKPSLRKRIKARIWPAKAEPVVPVPPMPKAEPALVPSDIIVRPVDPVDDLLDVPSSPIQPTPARKKRWFNR